MSIKQVRSGWSPKRAGGGGPRGRCRSGGLCPSSSGPAFPLSDSRSQPSWASNMLLLPLSRRCLLGGEPRGWGEEGDTHSGVQGRVPDMRTQEGSTYPRRGIRVMQSPVCASHTQTRPARQQLTSSMPSLARHSMSCRNRQCWHRLRPDRLPTRASAAHHEVATQHQRQDLRLRRRVAIVVAGQLPTPPSTGAGARLSVVARAEHAVETEQQQHQEDASGQPQCCHPVWEECEPSLPNTKGPPPPHLVLSLLVQGDVTMGLSSTRHSGCALPESHGHWPRWGPGTAAILRVPSFQSLPRVQMQCDWDDWQQADVPGSKQPQQAPLTGPPATAHQPCPPLLSTQDYYSPSSPLGMQDGDRVDPLFWYPNLAPFQTLAATQPSGP